MALLIALLAEEPTLEVHVFGGAGGGGRSGGSGSRTEGEATEEGNGDSFEDILRSAVRHWHQVLHYWNGKGVLVFPTVRAPVLKFTSC